MAEGGTEKVLCRYYLSGACQEGSQCSFSHDRQNGKPDMICRYYVKGNCFYGDRCRFDHIKHAPGRSKLTTKRDLSVKPVSSQKSSTSNVDKNSIREISSPKKIENWVNAPEFVPTGNRTYASAVKKDLPSDLGALEKLKEYCPYGNACADYSCLLLHGDLCEYCNFYCLHPTDEMSRKQHVEDCIKEHEQLMEHSFAMARSKDKTCGICMEIVVDKDPPSSRRFGILPNCSHTFCLSCIRTWRQAKQFENKIIRACPECRVSSDFVVPSRYWIEEGEDKLKLFTDYKDALGRKPCKHFNQGKGECPFANKCFYLHAFPDGTKVDVGPPKQRKRQNGDGDIEILESILLWHFLEGRGRAFSTSSDVSLFLPDVDSDSDLFSFVFFSDSDTETDEDF